MNAGASLAALGACLGAGVCSSLAGCQRESAPEPPAAESAPATPDRLAPGEQLPEAETAFGLALPAGMRVVRHFNDAAYFAGELGFDAVLDHLRGHLRAQEVQLLSQGAVFPRATVAGGDAKRLLRIELSKTPRGTQLHVKDITPPPAVSGLSEADIWRQAGRKPDGTPLDPNQLY
jgi:hypothetical protein